MVSSGNRRYGNPIIVHHDGSRTQPKRIPLNERSFEEGWLQDLIRRNPELLPVAEIAPAFSPPIAVGREVETAVGPIDNMFLSPQGYLTIVETKLWRNPEARREVVGQIIDYAKEVSHWTFDELEDRVRRYNRQYRDSDMGLVDTLRLAEDVDETEEQFIIDAVSRNLRQGRFLLLIVGDGIRESVEEMVDFLQHNPQLLFTLALVELQVHELNAGDTQSFLVVPQIVARTREVTRAVVRIEGKDVDSVHVGIDTDLQTSDRKPRAKTTLSADDFFDSLRQYAGKDDVEFAKRILNDMDKHPCLIDWKSASFVVKLPDPGRSGQNLTLFVVTNKGRAYVGWLPEQLQSINLPPEIGRDFVRESSQLFQDCEVYKSLNCWTRGVSLAELHDKYTEFTSILQRTVDRIIRASNQVDDRHRG